jgi:hypothetical protein
MRPSVHNLEPSLANQVKVHTLTRFKRTQQLRLIMDGSDHVVTDAAVGSV